MIKGILREIREQPPHIREIFMWLCVVATFSVIGYSWFRTTTKQFVALVNPEAAKQEMILAQQNQNQSQSPFATIAASWKNLTANISELFDFAKKTNDIQVENQQLPQIKPNLLPLSGNK